MSGILVLCLGCLSYVWTDGRSDGRSDGQSDGRSDGRTVGQTDGRTDGRTDERTEGRMSDWLVGQATKWTCESLLYLRPACVVDVVVGVRGTPERDISLLGA